MPVERTPDIRTIFWKTVLISTVYFIPVIRTYFPTPKGVLITDIHCIKLAYHKVYYGHNFRSFNKLYLTLFKQTITTTI